MIGLQQILQLPGHLVSRFTSAAPTTDISDYVAPVGPLRRRPRQATSPEATPGVPTLQIACADPTAEDTLRESHINRGLFLARQERWSDISDLIRDADTARSKTPGAMPLAELYAYGARADVVAAAEHVLIHGRPDDDAPILDGIEALEAVLQDCHDDLFVATIVAQAHMDIGWAWRGNGWDGEVPTYNREVYEAHFDRAIAIMDQHTPTDHNSPLIAAARCGLLGGQMNASDVVARNYQTLIALDPKNPRPMRALGMHLLPRWYGSYQKLELEARRTAAQTMDVWGAGAYTWVMFDAVGCDMAAAAQVDVEYYVDGLRDILARNADPYIVNVLAAHCANADKSSHSGDDLADQNRSQIAACAEWIVRDHLSELHPLIWAHAARGFDNNLRVYSPARFAASGREDATRIITDLFRKDAKDASLEVVFTDTEPQNLMS